MRDGMRPEQKKTGSTHQTWRRTDVGMSRDVTIQDGARKAGVTIATVSRVPNRSSNVASDPHTRVLDVIKNDDESHDSL